MILPDLIENFMAKTSCNNYTVSVELTSIDVKCGLVKIAVFAGATHGNQVDCYIWCLEDMQYVQTPDVDKASLGKGDCCSFCQRDLPVLRQCWVT